MKIGKISETILKRSILKQIDIKRDEVLIGAGVGIDCAAIELKDDEVFVVSTDPITGTREDIGMLGVNVCANDIAASGAEVVGILLTVLLPEDVTEEDVKEMMGQICAECRKLNIQPVGGHTEITGAVNQPIITFTGIGKTKKDKLVNSSKAEIGDDIVITKWIGLEGTSIIAKEKEAELLKRFAPSFVEEAKNFSQYLSIVPEAYVADKSGVHAMHDITEGGIFGALWEIGEAAGVGLEIDLKAIPVRQETIEICEIFSINPYKLISSGSLAIACKNGHDLVREMNKAGIKACVIGKVIAGNDRVVFNKDERRFLEPPAVDELYKIYE